MTDDILLLDLGGTNLRVGYGNKDQKSVLKISKQKIHANEELHKIIQEIVEGSKWLVINWILSATFTRWRF